MHISTANICKMVIDRADITIVIKCDAAYALSISIYLQLMLAHSKGHSPDHASIVNT